MGFLKQKTDLLFRRFRLYAGAQGADRIELAPFALEPWGEDITYHERLKRSYYMLKDYWNGLDE